MGQIDRFPGLRRPPHSSTTPHKTAPTGRRAPRPSFFSTPAFSWPPPKLSKSARLMPSTDLTHSTPPANLTRPPTTSPTTATSMSATSMHSSSLNQLNRKKLLRQLERLTGFLWTDFLQTQSFRMRPFQKPDRWILHAWFSLPLIAVPLACELWAASQKAAPFRKKTREFNRPNVPSFLAVTVFKHSFQQEGSTDF